MCRMSWGAVEDEGMTRTMRDTMFQTLTQVAYLTQGWWWKKNLWVFTKKYQNIAFVFHVLIIALWTQRVIFGTDNELCQIWHWNRKGFVTSTSSNRFILAVDWSSEKQLKSVFHCNITQVFETVFTHQLAWGLAQKTKHVWCAISSIY